MKDKILVVFFGLEIFLCVLLGVQSIRYWLDPLRWGWPQEIKQRGLILIILVVVMLLLSTILIKLSKLGINTRISVIFCIIISTLGFGLFVMLYLPKTPNIEEILKQEEYHPQDVALLTDCEKVSKFVVIGSRRLDIGNRTVLVPTWIHQSLEIIPKDILVDCFLIQTLEQESLVGNSDKFNEEVVQKLHALIFEANKLGILKHPRLANRLRVIACNKNRDYFGKLALESYIVNNNKLPAYDYYSKEGKERLYKEICD